MSNASEKVGPKGSLKPEETARLSEQIGGLARSALPLGPGLSALSDELPRGELRTSLRELAAALNRGVSLDVAMEQQDDRVPAHLRGLVQGGLRSGRLGEILSQFTAYLSIGTELKRKLWLSLAYPIMSIVVALALFVFVHVFVVAMFETIFRDFAIPLPGITLGMMLVSRVLRAGWPALVVFGGGILVFWLGLRVFVRAADRVSLATQVPVVGRVWRYISWAEFCHLLALLLESRLTLPEAVRLAGEGVENSNLARASVSMADDLERGVTLAQAMRLRREFPPGLSRLLRWATDNNAVAEILHMAGEMFEARSRSQAMFAGTVMAVLSVVIVLWGVFAVVGGLMLPLVTLISRLSG
jgi:type II secretory pathway component PulF